MSSNAHPDSTGSGSSPDAEGEAYPGQFADAEYLRRSSALFNSLNPPPGGEAPGEAVSPLLPGDEGKTS